MRQFPRDLLGNQAAAGIACAVTVDFVLKMMGFVLQMMVGIACAVTVRSA